MTILVRIQATSITDVVGRAGQGEVGRPGGVKFRAIDKDTADGGIDSLLGRAGWVDKPPTGREVV